MSTPGLFRLAETGGAEEQRTASNAPADLVLIPLATLPSQRSQPILVLQLSKAKPNLPVKAVDMPLTADGLALDM
jgi:hypothetical protein